MKVTSRFFILTAALYIFFGTARADVLVSEDFSGNPGDDLSNNGCTASGTIQVQSTTIGDGNYGAFTTENYTNYKQEFPSNLDSLAADEELIIQWAFQFDAAADGWVPVGVNLTDSDLGYGQTYNTQDFNGAIGHTSGGTYGGNGTFPVQLLHNTLYDMRTVITNTTISHEYKDRASPNWLVANTGTGAFHPDGVGEAFIDGQNTGFLIDTISVFWPEGDCTVGLPPDLDGVWLKDGTGRWHNSGNWGISPAPTMGAHTATFADAISAPTTVVVDTDVSINTITPSATSSAELPTCTSSRIPSPYRDCRP